MLAPPEADLFSFTEGFFYGAGEALFMKTYLAARPGYEINQAALRYYRLRRRLEDIADFGDSMMNDGLSSEDMTRSLWHFGRECEAVMPLID